ncbi:MAG: PEP-utilizing protein mobile subunit [Candidatus Rokuibacteriota bacterium]|nr:MAG: PEP-utilizing protein mobile subunit [Candidatus Rokubacteria bacterium]
MTVPKATRSDFPSPFEVPIPTSCEGWEEMYAYHVVFSEDRRARDEERFWFRDALHGPEPLCPFDSVWWDYAIPALNQASARLFVIPPSLGHELRILNGYVYLSSNSVADGAALALRAELFARRGGHYYRYWPELYERWVDKVEGTIHELETLVVPELPELEDEALVTEARGVGSSYELLVAYDRLLEGLDRVMQYHFELNNLGYGAYLVFYELCKQAFPDISDQTIARMISGIELLVLRPDEELRRLARLALELGVAEAVAGAVDEEALRAALAESEEGARWLVDFDETKSPWFCFSNGNGLYHHQRSWIDDTRLPLGAIGEYIRRLEAGEDISPPHAAVLAERERITDEYRSLLSEDTRVAFDESLALTRTVYPFLENHNFYIEHRYFTLFWNTVREFGKRLEAEGFLAQHEDIFFLRHDEVREALEELRTHWSSLGAGTARGPGHWPPIVERRRSIHETMRAWAPPPALGPVPSEITEPMVIMLFGITDERIQEWLSSSDGTGGRTLTGSAGSPGVAEGKARVIHSSDQLAEIEQGEILVAPATSPSWTPVFGTIAAAVLDSGGIMSHAAIVAREYGLPAVIGTGQGTKRIKTGDRVRVDADSGVVTILD